MIFTVKNAETIHELLATIVVGPMEKDGQRKWNAAAELKALADYVLLAGDQKLDFANSAVAKPDVERG
jgi:hypothetical protein